MKNWAIETLFPAFFIWQTLSMSQFTLKRNSYIPKYHKIHNIIASVSLFIQFVVFLYGFYNIELYIELKLPPILVVAGMISIQLNRMLSMITVMESWIKRSKEMEYLNKIAEVDEIMIKQLQIDMDYRKKNRGNKKILIIRLVLLTIVNISFLSATSSVLSPKKLGFYWTFLVIPQFIHFIRYHQIVSYMYLIRDRYRLLNKYIEKIDQSENEKNGGPMLIADYSNISRRDRRNFRTDFLIRKLLQIQRISRLLMDSKKLNHGLFKFSMILILITEFHTLLGGSYFAIFLFIKNGFTVGSLSGMSRIFVYACNLFIVARACHSANEEVTGSNFTTEFRSSDCLISFKVSKFSALMHNINLETRADDLNGLVSIEKAMNISGNKILFNL